MPIETKPTSIEIVEQINKLKITGWDTISQINYHQQLYDQYSKQLGGLNQKIVEKSKELETARIKEEFDKNEELNEKRKKELELLDGEDKK